MPSNRRDLDVSNASKDQKEKILDLAVSVRSFEIERFWQRSIFFWGFIAVAFVAYAQLSGKGVSQFFIACFGLVCSVAWTLQNRGSKYWQEVWENKVRLVEREVLGADVFQNREPIKSGGFRGPRAFSVTQLTIALSDFTVAMWITLAAMAFPRPASVASLWSAIVGSVVTAAYVGSLFACRQSEPSKSRPHRKDDLSIADV